MITRAPSRIPTAITALLAVLILLLAACAQETPAAETPGPEAAYTAAARTIMARLTLEAGQTAVAQLTRMALESTPSPTFRLPTLPPASPTPQPSPTSAPVSSPTPIPPTETPLPALCDRAEFVMNMSLTTGAQLVPGAEFIQTWRLKNVGTCTWEPGYDLVFLNGSPMEGDLVVDLPATVRPGEVVDVSLFLTAPDLPGEYQGAWMLRNNFGDMFGVGLQGETPLQVFVEVDRYEHNPNYAYDFAANYCSASWLSAGGILTCSGSSANPDGSAILLTNPALETRQEDELALWLRPNQASDGWISGQYPPYRVRDGDHFVAEVGCLDDSQGCDVGFQLNYQAGGTLRRLGSWREVFDGQVTSINLDLSFLAGQSVSFILETVNNGRASRADAYWFVPHIRNLEIEADLALEWRQYGGLIGGCNELQIYLIGGQRGEAQAYSCEGERSYLGDIDLTNSEVRQLTVWVERFSAFDVQVSRASSRNPEVTQLKFRGQGRREVTDQVIEDMESLAAGLFTLINQ